LKPAKELSLRRAQANPLILEEHMSFGKIFGILTIPALAAGLASCGNSAASDSTSQSMAADVDYISIVVRDLKFNPGQPDAPVTQICYALFAGPTGFPSAADKVVKTGCKDVDSTIVGFLIEELPPSPEGYAISFFQDMNKNGKLDTRSLFGILIPDEPFGFTNNPKPLSAPKYDQCKITPVKNGDKFEISMKTI
jgi:uncharacterized protein (DUF2141 family)